MLTGDGSEASVACLLKLSQILPGLPPAEFAASVDALPLVDTSAANYLMSPEEGLLAKWDWPLEVSKARVQV